MGTPRKPTALRLLEGNPGRRPLPKREPKPTTGISAAPPAHLSTEARVEWRRVSKILGAVGLLTGADRAALAAYCQAYGRWVQAEKALARMAERDEVTHGIIIKTSNGNAVQSPLVGAANRAMELMLKAATEFGMTPAARTRVEGGDALTPPSTPDQKPDATESRFFA